MNAVNESLASDPIEVLTEPSKECPFEKCDGTGWIWMKDWSKRHLRNVKDEWKELCECYEQRMKQREINRKLDLAHVPPTFKNATVASFDPALYSSGENIEAATIAKKAAGNFITNFLSMKERGKGLYLCSETKGSGKTRLASSIANALVKVHGVNVAFIKADDLLSQVKKTYQKDAQATESDVIKSFREVEVLVVDDIAVEKSSDFAERIFNIITDYRMDHQKVTIFTSNKPIDQLNDIYQEGRVGGRIKKSCIEVYMPEESIRDQEAEVENEEFERILFE